MDTVNVSQKPHQKFFTFLSFHIAPNVIWGSENQRIIHEKQIHP